MSPLEDVDIKKANRELKEKITEDIRGFLRVNFTLQREPLIDSMISDALYRYVDIDEVTGFDMYPPNIVKTVHDEIGTFTTKVDGKQLFDYLREVEIRIGKESIEAITKALTNEVLTVRTILMLILMLEKAKEKVEGLCGNCNHQHEKVAMIGEDYKIPLMHCSQCECNIFYVDRVTVKK